MGIYKLTLIRKVCLEIYWGEYDRIVKTCSILSV
jgi:hypothetical protein